MERITSRKNPYIMRLRQLASDASARRESGETVLDGLKLLGEALASGAEVTGAVFAEGAAPPEGLPPDVQVVELPAELLAYISTVETPQGMLALCRTPALTPPGELPPGRYLVLDGVQDPGNVGTIWRTADAFGAAGLLLLPGCAEPFAPKTVRATMGACFRLPVWEAELGGLSALLRGAGVPLYAAALRDDTADIREIPLDRAAVVIGSEGRGVSQAVLDRCEQTLKIPMRDRCESLNAAAAAAVVLWEGWR